MIEQEKKEYYQACESLQERESSIMEIEERVKKLQKQNEKEEERVSQSEMIKKKLYIYEEEI